MTKSTLNTLAYGLYDWAQSPLPTLHTTFIFAVYFATAVMPDGGSVAWAWLNAGTAIIIALAAPLLGVVADSNGWRKPLLAITSLASIICVSLLWL
ncbi:MAG: MFS transporter, partial [Candidatus Puniceispirillales bacterium]